MTYPIITKKVLYLRDMSELLELHEVHIRQCARDHNWESIPPGFKLGRRWAWLGETVDDWLRAKQENYLEQGAQHA